MKFNKIPLTLLLLLLIGLSAYGQRDKSKNRMTKPYYLQKGFISLNGGLYFFQKPKTITVPVFINPEITVARNITAGPIAAYYQYKHFVQYNADSIPGSKTLFPDDLTIYSHIMIGVKGNYHLNELINRLLKVEIPKKYDPYGGITAGYNIITVKSESNLWTATDEYEQSTIRAGFHVGLKFIHNKKLGGFMEYGYNDYGYGKFGLTWLISREKF